jgi:hypothetical protein
MHSYMVDLLVACRFTQMQDGSKPDACPEQQLQQLDLQQRMQSHGQHPAHNQQPAGVLQLLQPMLEDLQAQLTLQEQGGQAQGLQQNEAQAFWQWHDAAAAAGPDPGSSTPALFAGAGLYQLLRHGSDKDKIRAACVVSKLLHRLDSMNQQVAAVPAVVAGLAHT